MDHPDGLLDPTTYSQRLRRSVPRGWLVVEKILMPGESLPSDWPVDGTTGYDFLRDTVGLFVDPDAEGPLTELHRRLTGEDRDFETVTLDSRVLIARETLGSEVNRLAAVFVDICENQRRFRDFTRHEMREAIIAVAAAMPVYRTYARPREGYVSEADLAVIDVAVSSARERNPDLDRELLAFLGDILSLRVPGQAASELTGRFQQFTGAVMAKGIEDTAFYRYLRLVALNDVGCDPGHFGTSIEDYHASNSARAAEHPAAMLTTSTHDTKRSEDVRVRQATLSEAPDRWRRLAERWMRRFRRSWRDTAFDPVIGYLAAQTLVGAWPIDGERLSAYLLKAAREAKLRTSWTAPDEAYEESLDRFARSILADATFVADVERSIAAFVRAGRVNSLSQLVLKLTAPGVPDIYQGTELWDLSLVDPDNRRPVDFELRERLLADLDSAAEADPLRGPGTDALLGAVEVGLPKLWVMRQALALRGRRPEAFAPDAPYRALMGAGQAAHHVVAFARAERVVTITPRLPLRLARGRIGARLVAPPSRWADTRIELPSGRWRDVLTGDRHRVAATSRGLRVARVLDRFPVALLEREEP